MQRVIKTGNSLAVTVPTKFARDLGVKHGDLVKVERRPDRGALIIHFTGAQQLAISENLFRFGKKVSTKKSL